MTRNLNNSHLWDLKSDCTSAGSQYWYSALYRPALWVGISLLCLLGSVERVATYFTVQYSVHSIYIIWPYRSGSYDNAFLNLTKIVKYRYHDTTFSINQKKLQCFKFLVIFLLNIFLVFSKIVKLQSNKNKRNILTFFNNR